MSSYFSNILLPREVCPYLYSIYTCPFYILIFPEWGMAGPFSIMLSGRHWKITLPSLEMQHEEQTLRHGGLQKDILEREKEREQSGKKS